MTAWNGRRFYFLLFVTVAVAFVSVKVVSTYQSLYRGSRDISTVELKRTPSDYDSFVNEDYNQKSEHGLTSGSVLVDEKHDYNQKSKHDFSYNREIWDNHSPRITVLAGPHKTASTTIQSFFVKLTGLTVSVKNATDETTSEEFRTPSYDSIQWVWPLGVRSEYEEEFRGLRSPNKFYAPLSSFMSGRRTNAFFPNWKTQSEEEIQQSRVRIADYYRSLFRQVWKDGKKIVVGAESFDSLVLSLTESYTGVSDRGEETHISPDSSDMIDTLLDVFPWDTSNSTASLNTNDNLRNPSLRLEDIQVQINYRTPRIDHVVSIWHQLGKGTTLKKFVMKMGGKRGDKNFYQLNSLALALQFVRKGIKTTIVDMKGVSEKEFKNSTKVTTMTGFEETTTETVVGGLQGVVSCDIIKMGIDNGVPGMFCDEQSQLHLPNYELSVDNKNKKKDKRRRELTDRQMDDINRAFEEYDCGVWQHLKKYQEQGLLRVLYPSQHLFERCNPKISSRDVSFLETMEIAKVIASRNRTATSKGKAASNP